MNKRIVGKQLLKTTFLDEGKTFFHRPMMQLYALLQQTVGFIHHLVTYNNNNNNTK